MSTTIETYQIQFITKLVNNRKRNLMYSINDILDQFIEDFKTPDEINNFLLIDINNVLSGVSSSETTISESMVSAEMTSSVTNMFVDPDYQPTDPPDFSLPTTDLKQIAEAWLNYLTQLPM